MKKIKKFLYVGVTSTIIDYFIYSTFIFLGHTYVFAITIGYSIGFIINFILTRNYVFKNIKIKNFKIEFSLVLMISIIGLILNIGIVKVLYENLSIDLYISRILAISLVFFFNYFTRKGLVYE